MRRFLRPILRRPLPRRVAIDSSNLLSFRRNSRHWKALILRFPPPSGKPRWRAETTDPAGYLDLAACFDQAEHISAYALAYIYSPKQQDVALLTGSDDSMRLWKLSAGLRR